MCVCALLHVCIELAKRQEATNGMVKVCAGSHLSAAGRQGYDGLATRLEECGVGEGSKNLSLSLFLTHTHINIYTPAAYLLQLMRSLSGG